MAGYRGHIAGATTGGIVYAGAVAAAFNSQIDDKPQFLAEPQLLAGLVVVSVLFGLWPDVDTNSRGQDIFYSLAFIADIVLIFTHRMEAAAILGLLAMTPILGKHRGWTHSLWAMLLVPAAVFAIPVLYRPDLLTLATLTYGAGVVGYFSHLLLDGLIVRWFRVRNGALFGR
jgi:membrane-bound metal-dependent hydrolase YbcI (DUF457 family)